MWIVNNTLLTTEEGEEDEIEAKGGKRENSPFPFFIPFFSNTDFYSAPFFSPYAPNNVPETFFLSRFPSSLMLVYKLFLKTELVQ